MQYWILKSEVIDKEGLITSSFVILWNLLLIIYYSILVDSVRELFWLQTDILINLTKNGGKYVMLYQRTNSKQDKNKLKHHFDDLKYVNVIKEIIPLFVCHF